VETWIYKRPGLLQQSRPPAADAAGHGVYNWMGNVYSIFGAVMYKDGVALAGAVGVAGGVYRFSSCLGATPKMQFGDGVDAYNYDTGGGIALITDGEFPATFVKGWAFLDGTTYVMTADADIQGSEINDPVNWDSLNVIVAQIEPDQGVALSKQLVYVVALKQWSVEVFYDAGNPSGSPLGQVQGAKANIGCVSADSVQDIDGVLFWIASSRSSEFQIAAMESLKVDIVSTEPIERLLQGLDYSIVYSFQISLDGHRFYVVTIKNSNLTLAYDLDERSWHQWTDANGNYFPIVSSTFDASNRAILQHETNGRLYYCKQDYTTDDGVIILSDIVTPLFDGGIQSRDKMLSKLTVVGDKTSGSVLEVRKTDDDYQTWSNPRYVDMNENIPSLEDCGSFKRRAYWFRHAKPTKMRIRAVELQMDICTL